MKKDKRDLVFDWYGAWLRFVKNPVSLRPCPICWSVLDTTTVKEHQAWHEELGK